MKRFSRSIQCNNIRIMQDYLRRHSDIDEDSFALMTYRELCNIYANVIWYAKIFRIYFNKEYFFEYNKKKNAKKFGGIK